MAVSPTGLRLVRDRLLRLHKMLLDAERVTYERTYGRVGSSSEWLRLVLAHEHFAWLRPMSGLIVRIDDWVARADATTAEAEEFLVQAAALVEPADGHQARRLERTIADSPEGHAALEATRRAVADAQATDPAG